MSDPGGTAEYLLDAPTRCFHWMHLAFVFVLALSRYGFQYQACHVSEKEAKMTLKAAHARVGHVFAINHPFDSSGHSWETELPAGRPYCLAAKPSMESPMSFAHYPTGGPRLTWSEVL